MGRSPRKPRFRQPVYARRKIQKLNQETPPVPSPPEPEPMPRPRVRQGKGSRGGLGRTEIGSFALTPAEKDALRASTSRIGLNQSRLVRARLALAGDIPMSPDIERDVAAFGLDEG